MNRLRFLSPVGVALALSFGSAAPSEAQMMSPPAYVSRPYVATYRPAYRNPQAVVPRFAPRGGRGTTPYLGNTRGLGAYSYNYDRTYARPSPGGRGSRRYR